MRTVLQRGLRFAEIAALAEAEGWRSVPIPGLRPPLIPGEPELARFERGNEILLARFNPAVGLRVLEGPTVRAAPVLDARGITGLIESPDPETALCGILAAEAAGLSHLEPAMAEAARRLSPPADAVARAATGRLVRGSGTLPAGAGDTPAGALPAVELLPLDARRRVLRAAIAVGNGTLVEAFAERCRPAESEIAATVAIGAARLGLSRLAPALRRRVAALADLPRRDRELVEAVRKAALETLAGGVPGPGGDPRDRLWRAVLGRGGVDAIAMRVAALVDPLPEPSPHRIVTGLSFVRVSTVDHWLGHDGMAGMPSPVRRWRPETTFWIASSPAIPSDAGGLADHAGGVDAAGIEAALSRLAGDGRSLSLPSPDVWEAALRGPDGRPRPWGLGRRPDRGAAASPWGAVPGPRRMGEWALGPEGLVVCGADPDGLVAVRHRPEAGSRHVVRPVLDA